VPTESSTFPVGDQQLGKRLFGILERDSGERGLTLQIDECSYSGSQTRVDLVIEVRSQSQVHKQCGAREHEQHRQSDSDGEFDTDR
jgi:hypothetical protein